MAICKNWWSAITAAHNNETTDSPNVAVTESDSGLTSQRCPGRCLWSVRRRPWGWCSWCSCTVATSSEWRTGSSCEQTQWWTVQKGDNKKVQSQVRHRHGTLTQNKKGKTRISDEKTLLLTSSVLYIPIPQPPVVNSYTSHSFGLLPSVGVNTILNLPGWSTTKSVALYWEIKASRHTYGIVLEVEEK